MYQIIPILHLLRHHRVRPVVKRRVIYIQQVRQEGLYPQLQGYHPLFRSEYVSGGLEGHQLLLVYLPLKPGMESKANG